MAIDRAGRWLAVALGDGRVRLVDLRATDGEYGQVEDIEAHAGAVLALTADPTGSGFLSGGDDGRVVHLVPGVAPETVAYFPGKWVEQIAIPGSGVRYAVAAGKQVHLRALSQEQTITVFDHPSTVSGLAFNPKGKRLAAAHYNGVSLWWANPSAQNPTVLPWRGSHIALTWSPNGEYVVTGTQENAMHGWRLSDRADMQMNGYAAKPRSFAWTPRGQWLATSGAETIVCWPFTGAGPMGRAPCEIGPARDWRVTRVAAHPRREIVAGGFDTGAVILADIPSREHVAVRAEDDGAVTALTWTADGRCLAYGTENGTIAITAIAGRTS
jgi:WD40 repeat protein